MTVEKDSLIVEYIINNTNSYQINIPDLYTTPYIVSPTLLGSQQYYFEYYWNNRTELAYLSIYRIINNTKEYLVKNICLIQDIYIDDYIKNEDWTGFLQFTNIEGGTDITYTLKDISEKFRLIYAYLEE